MNLSFEQNNFNIYSIILLFKNVFFFLYHENGFKKALTENADHNDSFLKI